MDFLDKQRAYWKRLLDSGLGGAFFGIETLNDKSAQVIGMGLGLSYKEAFSLVPGDKASIELINEVVSSRIKANLERESWPYLNVLLR